MWKKLTIDDLKSILSQDELDKLQQISVDPTMTNVVEQSIQLVSNMFRGAFQAKGYAIDVREYYVPSSYFLPILQLSRETAWSRFPNSPVIALDEVRKEEVKRLWELLKNPYIGTDKPDPEHSSDNPDVTGEKKIGSVTLPFLRFDEQLYWWNQTSKIK